MEHLYNTPSLPARLRNHGRRGSERLQWMSAVKQYLWDMDSTVHMNKRQL